MTYNVRKASQWGSNKGAQMGNTTIKGLDFVTTIIGVILLGIGKLLKVFFQVILAVLCGGSVATFNTIIYLKWMWLFLAIAVWLLGLTIGFVLLCNKVGVITVVISMLLIVAIGGIFFSIHMRKKEEYRRGSKRRARPTAHKKGARK